MGKMISSRNSTRHGFYASNVLLPKDDRQFLRFARRFAFAYAPRDALEEQEVRTIIETRWQLRRTDLVETELYQMFGFYEDQERSVGTAFANDASQANAFSKLARYSHHQRGEPDRRLAARGGRHLVGGLGHDAGKTEIQSTLVGMIGAVENFRNESISARLMSASSFWFFTSWRYSEYFGRA
jgi:hypothetical protein